MLGQLAIARQRFAHAPAVIADLALARHQGPGRGERARERLAERDVAQVADVQRLGGVGVAEVDHHLRAPEELARVQRTRVTRLQELAEVRDAGVGEAHRERVPARGDGGDLGQLRERLARGAQRRGAPSAVTVAAEDLRVHAAAGVVQGDHRELAPRRERAQRACELVEHVTRVAVEGTPGGARTHIGGLEGRCS